MWSLYLLLTAEALVRTDGKVSVDENGETFGITGEVDEDAACCALVGDEDNAVAGFCLGTNDQCSWLTLMTECDEFASKGGVLAACPSAAAGARDAEDESVADAVSSSADDEAAEPEIGTPCDRRNDQCGAGFVCSTGNVCKHAALELCTPTGFFSASNCASAPYGAGHKFQCLKHRGSIGQKGQKRCCIDSQGKHLGSVDAAKREHRLLTQAQYQAAHPDRTQTKDGVQVAFEELMEPQLELLGAISGAPTTPEPKGFLTDACCSGWAVYGRKTVAEEARVWFCGWYK